MLIYRQSDYTAACPPFLATRRSARVVRLASQALWFPARKDDAGAALIERADWEDIRRRCPGLAPFAALPRLKRRDALRAWILDGPLSAMASDPDALLALLRGKLVACDHTDATDALAAVERLIAWAEAGPDEPISGSIAPPAEPGAGVLTLYLDTSPTCEWPALARMGKEWAFGFAGGVAFVPQPLSGEELEETRSAQRACASARRAEELQLTFSFI